MTKYRVYESGLIDCNKRYLLFGKDGFGNWCLKCMDESYPQHRLKEE